MGQRRGLLSSSASEPQAPKPASLGNTMRSMLSACRARSRRSPPADSDLHTGSKGQLEMQLAQGKCGYAVLFTVLTVTCVSNYFYHYYAESPTVLSLSRGGENRVSASYRPLHVTYDNLGINTRKVRSSRLRRTSSLQGKCECLRSISESAIFNRQASPVPLIGIM